MDQRSGRPRAEQDPLRPGAARARVKFFEAVRDASGHAHPHYPYFHLKTEGFRHLASLPGREAVVEAMATARSVAAVTGNIAWVSLDPELHILMLAEPSRTALREQLLAAWFGGRHEALPAVLDEERGIDRYQTRLRDSPASGWRRIRREMSTTSHLILANHATAAIANPLY